MISCRSQGAADLCPRAPRQHAVAGLESDGERGQQEGKVAGDQPGEDGEKIVVQVAQSHPHHNDRDRSVAMAGKIRPDSRAGWDRAIESGTLPAAKANS